MKAFFSRRIQALVLTLVSLCFVDIAWYTLSWARNFKALYGKDEVSRVTALFKPLSLRIPYHDKFNVLEENVKDMAIKRYVQYALVPRPYRKGRSEKWLIYYSPHVIPLPAEIDKDYELVLAAPGGASLYRRKE